MTPPIRSRRDAEDVDAPGGVFDHRQDISGGAVEQVCGECHGRGSSIRHGQARCTLDQNVGRAASQTADQRPDL